MKQGKLNIMVMLFILNVLAIGSYIIVKAITKEQPVKERVCRDERGHRIDCPKTSPST